MIGINRQNIFGGQSVLLFCVIFVFKGNLNEKPLKLESPGNMIPPYFHNTNNLFNIKNDIRNDVKMLVIYCPWYYSRLNLNFLLYSRLRLD